MIQYHHIARKICSNLIKQSDHLSSVWYNGQGASVLLLPMFNDRRPFSTLTRDGKFADKLPTPVLYQPAREYAARKGTRARKAAKKVKKVEVKEPFMFKQLKKLAELPYKNLRPLDDSMLPPPVDDVYFFKKFRYVNWDFDEAVNNLRETHHPSVYNVPNAPLHLRVNLDMKYPNRPTKCMDGWRSVIEMKQPFLLEGMTRPSVLAFCIEDVDYIDNVKQNGADLAGGKELIKAIQAGEVNPDDFEYLVAHPSVVPDLTVIRGLIKKKFPTVKNKTISVDLVPEIIRLKSGIKVQVIKNDREPDFAYIDTPIGTLDMDGMVENFNSIIRDTIPRRVSGKTPEEFVISCVLRTPGNGFEELRIDTTKIIREIEAQKQTKATAVAENAGDD